MVILIFYRGRPGITITINGQGAACLFFNLISIFLRGGPCHCQVHQGSPVALHISPAIPLPFFFIHSLNSFIYSFPLSLSRLTGRKSKCVCFLWGKEKRVQSWKLDINSYQVWNSTWHAQFSYYRFVYVFNSTQFWTIELNSNLVIS